MAKTAAQLMVEFSSQGADKVAQEARGLGRTVDDVGKKSGFMGTALGTAVGFGTIGLVTSLGREVFSLGKGILGLSGDAEQMKMSLETAVGPRTEQVFKDLQKFAKDTPFEFPELLQSTVNLENFGIKADQVIGDTGRNWTQIIGDTASAMGKTYDQVTQAVLDASTGEYERLKELGVKATVEGDKVKFSYMKNGKQITAEADRNNSEMIQSTLGAIWNDKYQGAMEKQSKSFNGMWSTMQDNVRMTTQRMTGSIFGFAKDGLKHANLFFDRLNVGLDRGMGLFDATMRATKFTLQDVFGKSAGNTIFAGIDAIASGFEKSARFGKAFATGVFNVGAALGSAFFGADRKQFIQNLPDWAQKTAKGFSTIAEAGGDLFRSFQRGGFDAMWQTLTSGGEGEQIINAIQGMLGDLAGHIFDFGEWTLDTAAPAVIGWVSEHIGDAWDAIKGIAGWGADQVGEFVGWTLNVGEPSVEMWTKDVWGWVRGKLGIDFSTTGDGTGGPESDRQPISIKDWFIDVAEPGAIGWIAGGAGNLHDWLEGKFFGGGAGDPNSGSPGSVRAGMGGGMVFDIQQIGLRVLSAVADLTTADINTAIQNEINDAKAIATETYEWAVLIGLVPEFSWGGGGTNGSQDPAQGGGGPIIPIVPWLNEQFGDQKWYQTLKMVLNYEPNKEDSETARTKIQGWIDALGDLDWDTDAVVEGLFDGLATSVSIIPNPFSGLGGTISGWLSEAWGTPNTGFAGQGARDAILGTGGGGGLFDEISQILDDSLIGEIADIAGMVPGWTSSITDTVKGIIPDSVDMPGINFKDSALIGSITDFIGTLDGYIETIGDRIAKVFRMSTRDASANYQTQYAGYYGEGGDPNTVKPGDTNAPLGSNYGFNMGIEATPTDLQGNGAALGIAAQPVVIKYTADTSEATQTVNDLKGLFGGGSDGSGSTFKATLDFDTGPAAVKYSDAFGWGTVFQGTTFTGKLDLDNGPAAVAYTDAFNWGTIWDAATFTSTFAADNGPAAVAYTDAYGWGDTWAGTVFTASFAIDVSGLYAARDIAAQVAQDIADLMPHSPARKGPLREPIKFDHIADNMRGVASRLRGYAADSAGYVAGAFGGLAGPVPANRIPVRATMPNGGTTIVQIFPLKTDEYEELIRNAQMGGRVARNLARELQLQMGGGAV